MLSDGLLLIKTFPVLRKKSSNQLTGTLPEGDDSEALGNGEFVPGRWSNLAKLNVVLLHDNQLSGTLPSDFFEACASPLVK